MYRFFWGSVYYYTSYNWYDKWRTVILRTTTYGKNTDGMQQQSFEIISQNISDKQF